MNASRSLELVVEGCKPSDHPIHLHCHYFGQGPKVPTTNSYEREAFI